MTEALSLMYGIDLPARSIVGLPAEQERTLFLVGTLSLKQDNQVNIRSLWEKISEAMDITCSKLKQIVII